MTPQERQMLMEIYQWMQEKKRQQISFPVDQTSKDILGAVTDEGAGSTALTQTISLSGSAEDITVPKAYADTVMLLIGNTRYEIPYL